jgi:ribonuclease J
VTESDTVEIVPLGGLGEFGMNMMALRCGSDIAIIDAGLMFPRDDLLGVDLVVPELTYLLEHRDEVRAVILTHGHEDHIGGLSYLLEEIPVPVYGTALTLGFAEGRLAERGVLKNTELRQIKPRETLQIGKMLFEFLRVTHSISDSIGLAVTTPAGVIIHTGDFKFDQSPTDHQVSDYSRFAFFGENGVLALLSDSTNSERPGYTPSESNVRRHLEQVFYASRQKIIAACFASSIPRIQMMMDLAAEFGRKVVPMGRSMRENIAIAHRLGYLDVPLGVLVESSEGAKLPDHQLVLLCTGSQGEPMAALSKLALDKLKEFQLEPGDSIVVSARVIPGNETRISHLINHFCRRGANVYDESHWMVHVSGHASQEELKLMLNLTRPRFFIPIHGEYRQLYHHALVARQTGIPPERILIAETGDVISLSTEGVVIGGKAPVGRRFIDQDSMGELDEFVVKDRQQMSEEGVILAVIPISKATGLVKGSPELVSRGHLQEEDSAALLSDAKEAILHTLEDCSDEERADSLILTELVRSSLKRFFRKNTSTRPMIIPVVLEV